ncbi:alpha/beta-hydrolase [Rhizoclosmatium globosum]|uniref:Alpha/beta-hydrolase n=1 Tax=Rhizoclosmatium globosum TaxID=329046 RepID=A0A1Y2BP12_9FUNG|nr:alpha/beta-hydrolase [Rhizoclosmatium globosum]|eukprot:ORY36479.1 alpha/beta-hydrolase [Rhizoclosmatium globosum]
MWNLAVSFLVGTRSFQVCVFDGRSVGDSTECTGFSIKDLANDALLLLDHLGWSDNVYLVAYSLGGMVAQNMVLMAPHNRFRSVALINTAAKGWFTRWFPPLNTLWKFLLAGLGFIPLKTTTDLISFMLSTTFPKKWLAQKPTWTNEFLTNHEFMTKYVIARSAGKTRQTSKGRAAQSAAVWTHGLTVKELKSIGTKTKLFIFSGRKDEMIRASNSDYLVKYTGGTSIRYEDCGHALFEQEFERFHKQLLEEVLI